MLFGYSLDLISKKHANFEMLELKIIRINFDDIWQKYSKDSRIEYACFSFRVGLVFFINFSSFRPKIMQIYFDAASSKCTNVDEVQFFL